MKPQYIAVAELLRERIQCGDYFLTEIPASKKLAEELRVSHIVVRKALEKLLEEGLCRHLPNGRLAVNPETGTGRGRMFSFALLQPAYPSPYFPRCAKQVEEIVREKGGVFRQIVYVHWNDPAIRKILENFDGVFLIGSTEPPDAPSLELFREHRGHLATLDFDLTEYGIPRLAFFDSSCVAALMEHLAERGCRRIDCVNTQPEDRETVRRFDAWRDSRKRLGISGTLHNTPVRHYDDPTGEAYRLMDRLLSGKELDTDALFCTNESIACGVNRALIDHGMRPGREFAVVCIGDLGLNRYVSPSVTAVEMPDLRAEIKRIADWMSAPVSVPWKAPLTLLPEKNPVFFGESTMDFPFVPMKKNKIQI